MRTSSPFYRGRVPSLFPAFFDTSKTSFSVEQGSPPPPCAPRRRPPLFSTNLLPFSQRRGPHLFFPGSASPWTSFADQKLHLFSFPLSSTKCSSLPFFATNRKALPFSWDSKAPLLLAPKKLLPSPPLSLLSFPFSLNYSLGNVSFSPLGTFRPTSSCIFPLFST